MSASIDKVQAELEALGFTTSVFDTPQRRVVSFNYVIEVGPRKGTELTVGIGFQEEGYPEYPPHWIYVTPPLADGKGGAIGRIPRQRGAHLDRNEQASGGFMGPTTYQAHGRLYQRTPQAGLEQYQIS